MKNALFMTRLYPLIGALLLCLITMNTYAQRLLVLKVPSPEKSQQLHGQYFSKLLALAMDRTTASDGPYRIEEAQQKFTSNRVITELLRNSNHVNVIWTSNSAQREQQLLPIKISILRGLNSYRVFLIRADDQEKFHLIHNLNDLKQLQAGQGGQWPDTQVMQNNGLPVVTTAQSDLLFDMLASKRFDYFPRGLYEVWGEQKLFAGKGLIIEDSLMLHYPSPIYFFVNKKDKALADRIERGLRIAQADGSFDQLFFSISSFKQGYEELHHAHRQRIDLQTDFQDQD